MENIEQSHSIQYWKILNKAKGFNMGKYWIKPSDSILKKYWTKPKYISSFSCYNFPFLTNLLSVYFLHFVCVQYTTFTIHMTKCVYFEYKTYKLSTNETLYKNSICNSVYYPFWAQPVKLTKTNSHKRIPKTENRSGPMNISGRVKMA